MISLIRDERHERASRRHLVNTIVVMITSRVQRAIQDPTQLLIDISTSDG
jgi:hypothetical protein